MNHKLITISVLSTFLLITANAYGAYFPSQSRQNHGPNPYQKQFTNQQAIATAPATKPSGKLSDSQLESKIQAALQKGSKNYNDTVNFEVEGGKVTLSGTVDTFTDIELIEERLNGITEITALDNRLEIRPDRNPTTRWHTRDYEQVQKVKNRY